MLSQKNHEFLKPSFSGSSTKDVELIYFSQFSEPDSFLSIFSSHDKVPFAIQRVFTVDVQKACVRGFHAHKQCCQLMIVLRGRCTVVCDDGKKKEQYVLDSSASGLLVPAGIWAHQEYEKDSLLMVLTDQLYDPADYIRDYKEFLLYKGVV